MDTDPNKQRRNLLVLGAGLFVYEIGGGKLTGLKLLGGGLTVANPARILDLTFCALIYVLWRYWLCHRALHGEFERKVSTLATQLPPLSTIIQKCETQFREKSGVERGEEMQRLAISDTNGTFIPVGITRQIAESIFRRKLVLEVENIHGGYHPSRCEYPLSYAVWATSSARALFQLMTTDRTFSDLYVPYIVSGAALLLHWINHGAV